MQLVRPVSVFNGEGVLHIWFHSGLQSIDGLKSLVNLVPQKGALYQAELPGIETMQLSLH